eukprot:g76209.t1
MRISLLFRHSSVPFASRPCSHSLFSFTHELSSLLPGPAQRLQYIHTQVAPHNMLEDKKNKSNNNNNNNNNNNQRHPYSLQHNLYRTELVSNEERNRLVSGLKAGLAMSISSLVPAFDSSWHLLSMQTSLVALVTVAAMSEPTIGGVISRGSVRTVMNMLGGVAAYAAAAALSALHGPAASAGASLALLVFSSTVFYMSRLPAFAQKLPMVAPMTTVAFACLFVDLIWGHGLLHGCRYLHI